VDYVPHDPHCVGVSRGPEPRSFLEILVVTTMEPFWEQKLCSSQGLLYFRSFNVDCGSTYCILLEVRCVFEVGVL